MPMASETVLVLDRSSAGRVLCSPSRRRGIAYVISIGAPGEPAAAGFTHIPRRLRLTFEDTDDGGPTGPMPSDIERLIAFGRSVDLSSSRLLVHCESGISRSSAAALIVLVVSKGALDASTAAKLVLAARPQARPNRRMLSLADSQLGLPGTLHSAALAHFSYT
jgi:predicted protein tyrosine phosphatase